MDIDLPDVHIDHRIIGNANFKKRDNIFSLLYVNIYEKYCSHV